MIAKNGMFLIKMSFCALLFVSLSGCWNNREMEDLAIVVGIGIDQADTPGNILFTAQIVKPSQAGKSSTENAGGGFQDTKAFFNASSIKSSVFEAVRDLTHQTGEKLFVAHNQVVIFGKELAAQGIQKYFDFFMRAHEVRPDNLVLVARGAATEVLDVKPEIGKLPALNIDKLVQSYGLTSQLLKINLQDFAERLMSKTISPIAPLVGISLDKETPSVFVSGMAVFKKDKMIGTLSEAETRGLLWVIGQVQSGVIVVAAPGGQGSVTLEIMNSKSKVTPELKGNQIRIRIQINEDAGLTEQSTPENMATPLAFAALEKEQGDTIRREIMQAFQKSKELNSDIFGFGEMIHQKHFAQWRQMEGRWSEIYPTLELEMHVRTKIRKTDLITRPAASAE